MRYILLAILSTGTTVVIFWFLAKGLFHTKALSKLFNRNSHFIAF
jgi:hypothetical protein